MTSEPPRRGRPGHDQASVLRTAIDLFIRQGYDATSMGDLARELGLSKSTLYHHVPSKSHLLEQALREALDGLDGAVTAAESAPAPALERLHSVVVGSVDVLVAHQPAVTLLLRVRGNSAPEQAALARRRAIDARLAALVLAAVEDGSVRSDLSPDLAGRLLFGMVNSLVEWHRPGGTIDSAALGEAVWAVAFDGLLSRPQQPSQLSKSTVTRSPVG